MKSQLFKKEIPKDLLYNFLDKYAIDKGDYYLFTTISYQKAKFHKELEKFLDIIKEYYYPAKQSYITRKMSYNNFTTILRQICKSSLITYISKVKYEKLTYGIEYYIYK